MREDNCTIRLAERGDGALLSALFAQLGYPTPGEEVDGRLIVRSGGQTFSLGAVA